MKQRALKVVLILVGVVFVAGVYPITIFLLHPGQDEATVPMMLSLYVALGIFLIIAARDPPANRSLIAYAGWANIAHAAVMIIQSFQLHAERMHLLIGVAMFGIIGLVLIALVPAKTPVPRPSPVT